MKITSRTSALPCEVIPASLYMAIYTYRQLLGAPMTDADVTGNSYSIGQDQGDCKVLAPKLQQLLRCIRSAARLRTRAAGCIPLHLGAARRHTRYRASADTWPATGRHYSAPAVPGTRRVFRLKPGRYEWKHAGDNWRRYSSPELELLEPNRRPYVSLNDRKFVHRRHDSRLRQYATRAYRRLLLPRGN
jgi:hypothetical protein